MADETADTPTEQVLDVPDPAAVTAALEVGGDASVSPPADEYETDPVVEPGNGDEPQAPPEPTEDEPEGFAALASGRVRIKFDGNTITLRRPKFNELLSYVDLLEACDEKIAEVTQTNPIKQLATRLTEQDAVAVWVFKTFGDKRLPDDHPSWIASVDFLSMLRQHWQAVPLLPGNA